MKKPCVSGIIVGCLLMSCSGSGGKLSGWQDEVFDVTPVTGSESKTILVANPSTSDEQHLLSAGFLPYSNSEGHFRIDAIKVGDQEVSRTDIVIPPGGVLRITVSYVPQNLETTKAAYGGWLTGQPEQWEPQPVQTGEAKPIEEEKDVALHRALVELVYAKPEEGMVYVHLVGKAVAGPQGEIAAGGQPGDCHPGDGTACYSGGFAIDIPALIPSGPKDLVMTGDIPFTISEGSASLMMDGFPHVLFYLRSTEVPQLPSGVTATLIISGAPGVTAEGSFDGARLELANVAFRIRVVLGELQPEQITPGLPALVDFVVKDIEITTTEPYSQGNITLHLETTLGEAPSGNELFDQFLSGAAITAIMQGQLAF
ncbi:MAG: hypothetical protein HY465_00225 [Deltaproteobacteria bacterium]|nr:hypothetical protein [Deltaproteobacteria bacterium]